MIAIALLRLPFYANYVQIHRIGHLSAFKGAWTGLLAAAAADEDDAMEVMEVVAHNDDGARTRRSQDCLQAQPGA